MHTARPRGRCAKSHTAAGGSELQLSTDLYGAAGFTSRGDLFVFVYEESVEAPLGVALCFIKLYWQNAHTETLQRLWRVSAKLETFFLSLSSHWSCDHLFLILSMYASRPDAGHNCHWKGNTDEEKGGACNYHPLF